MTLAVAEQRRRSTAIEPTREQRRAALIELAEHISAEDRHPAAAPLTPVLPWLVTAVASRKCTDPVGCFNELVEAVAEFSAFTADEGHWLVEHDLRDTNEARTNQSERLQADIDSCADRLMGVAR